MSQELVSSLHNWAKNEMGVFVVCDALRDLVPFVQFKKREKHSWRSVTLY